MFRVGIVGGSGYTGAELLRLCHSHPDLEVAWATADTQVGTPVAGLYPSLAGAYGSMSFVPYASSLADDVDLVFLALPHGASQDIVPGLLDRGRRVVDLAADFRLLEPSAYEQWYGEAHRCPKLLGRLAYGLPELFRDDIAKADGVAAPGCYPTAAALALAPLVRAGAIMPEGVIVDAASGVSGAGRALRHTSHYGTVNEDFVAYGLLDHRHTPEIEQAVNAFGHAAGNAFGHAAGNAFGHAAGNAFGHAAGNAFGHAAGNAFGHAAGSAQVLFTPHLAPMTRGILATCYARPLDPATSTDDLLAVLADAYAGEPFVVVRPTPPSTKATWGSNSVHLTARADPRTGWVVVLAALDNLVKGASGQAVQCANLLLGLPETAGLSVVGVYP